MTHINYRSNSCIQISSLNKYKYDKYGFLIVNNLEDLLYDQFNSKDNIIDEEIKKNYQNINRRKTCLNNFYSKNSLRFFNKGGKRSSLFLNSKFKNNSNYYKNYKTIKSIPKAKKSFFTKIYSEEINNRILTLPKSSICYFQKTKQLIMINTFRPLIPVKNKLFFFTRQIIRLKKTKSKSKEKTTIKGKMLSNIINSNNNNDKKKKKFKPKLKLKLSNKLNDENNKIPNIHIKILGSKVSSVSRNKQGKIYIKAKLNTIVEKNLNNKIFPITTDRKLLYFDKKIGVPVVKNSLIKDEIRHNSTSKNNILNGKYIIKDEDKNLNIDKIFVKNSNKINSANHKIESFIRNNSMFTSYQSDNKFQNINNKNNKNKNGGTYLNNNYNSLFPAIESYFCY